MLVSWEGGKIDRLRLAPRKPVSLKEASWALAVIMRHARVVHPYQDQRETRDPRIPGSIDGLHPAIFDPPLGTSIEVLPLRNFDMLKMILFFWYMPTVFPTAASAPGMYIFPLLELLNVALHPNPVVSIGFQEEIIIDGKREEDVVLQIARRDMPKGPWSVGEGQPFLSLELTFLDCRMSLYCNSFAVFLFTSALIAMVHNGNMQLCGAWFLLAVLVAIVF